MFESVNGGTDEALTHARTVYYKLTNEPGELKMCIFTKAMALQCIKNNKEKSLY